MFVIILFLFLNNVKCFSDHSLNFLKGWYFFMRFSRNFCFLLYDDSMNPDFITVLSGFGEKAFVVYHDRDINSDGTQKKPHYHVMVMCHNCRSEKVVSGLVHNCGGANDSYLPVVSKRGYARYLCHMDNPEKMCYEPDEVMCLCGADYLELALTKTDKDCQKNSKMKEVLHYCQKNKIIHYCELVDYCMDYRPDWMPCFVGSHGRVIRSYVQSLEYKLRRG